MDNSLWCERFGRRRELFLNVLRAAGSGFDPVTYRLVNGAYTFGWAFEHGDEPNPFQLEGGVEFAESFCRHTIDQGLGVAFATEYTPERVVVWLVAWEADGDKPEWPDGIQIAVTCMWTPVRARSELLG